MSNKFFCIQLTLFYSAWLGSCLEIHACEFPLKSRISIPLCFCSLNCALHGFESDSPIFLEYFTIFCRIATAYTLHMSPLWKHISGTSKQHPQNSSCSTFQMEHSSLKVRSKRSGAIWVLILFSFGLLLPPGACIPKRLAAVGGMGTMLSPSAKHMVSSVAKFDVVHLRASAQSDRIARWKQHGARLVEDLEEVLDADVDALLVCVGKNGDDLPILQRACDKWAGTGRAIFHLSTVSPSFVRAAGMHCRENGIRYANYPLTGGPSGAEQATMLLLASGDKDLYDEYLPIFELLGTPRFFGEDDGRGAEVKLQGQIMVFGGLLGVSSATAASFAVLQESVAKSESVSNFIAFLNGGAGSTKQWDVAVSRGVRDGDWSEGFQLQHAVVDAIYAADMAQELRLSSVVRNQLLCTAAIFSYILRESRSDRVATQALVKELANSAGLDSFLEELWPYMADFPKALKVVIGSLPEKLQKRVLLDVSRDSFQLS